MRVQWSTQPFLSNPLSFRPHALSTPSLNRTVPSPIPFGSQYGTVARPQGLAMVIAQGQGIAEAQRAEQRRNYPQSLPQSDPWTSLLRFQYTQPTDPDRSIDTKRHISYSEFNNGDRRAAFVMYGPVSGVYHPIVSAVMESAHTKLQSLRDRLVKSGWLKAQADPSEPQEKREATVRVDVDLKSGHLLAPPRLLLTGKPEVPYHPQNALKLVHQLLDELTQGTLRFSPN